MKSLSRCASLCIVRHLQIIDIKELRDVRDICHYFGNLSPLMADCLRFAFSYYPKEIERKTKFKPYTDYLREVLELNLLVHSYRYANQTFLLNIDSFAAIKSSLRLNGEAFFGGVTTVKNVQL